MDNGIHRQRIAYLIRPARPRVATTPALTPATYPMWHAMANFTRKVELRGLRETRTPFSHIVRASGESPGTANIKIQLSFRVIPFFNQRIDKIWIASEQSSSQRRSNRHCERSEANQFVHLLIAKWYQIIMHYLEKNSNNPLMLCPKVVTRGALLKNKNIIQNWCFLIKLFK